MLKNILLTIVILMSAVFARADGMPRKEVTSSMEQVRAGSVDFINDRLYRAKREQPVLDVLTFGGINDIALIKLLLQKAPSTDYQADIRFKGTDGHTYFGKLIFNVVTVDQYDLSGSRIVKSEPKVSFDVDGCGFTDESRKFYFEIKNEHGDVIYKDGGEPFCPFFDPENYYNNRVF